MMKEKQKTNRVLTIVLILGTVTVFFPLYMAAIIAFKKPSEMTNDVAGALSFPKHCRKTGVFPILQKQCR
jgi:raffinose/stachyose/melibiose transport system permease protein